MKFKIHFTDIGFGLLIFILSGCSLLPEKTVDEKSVPSVAQEQTKEYRSEFMKISLQIPVDWVVEEGSTAIELKSQLGIVRINRNGTNWDGALEYLQDFDNKRTKLTVIEENNDTIKTYDAIERIEKFGVGPVSERKVYYIYTNNLVFTLSTSTPEIYDNLDQIAQSFRYFGK